MKKICEWCKCEFETQHGKAQYCSGECAAMAHRKHCFLKREAKAKELGVTIEEVERLTRSGLLKHALEAKRLGLTIEEVKRRKKAEWYAKKKALAEAAGMGVKEYIRIFGRHVTRKDDKRSPKSYAQIRAHNKAHPIAAGWRGAPVMGGGSVRYNDGDLKQSEL